MEIDFCAFVRAAFMLKCFYLKKTAAKNCLELPQNMKFNTVAKRSRDRKNKTWLSERIKLDKLIALEEI
jgi:hypothetical protein